MNNGNQISHISPYFIPISGISDPKITKLWNKSRFFDYFDGKKKGEKEEEMLSKIDKLNGTRHEENGRTQKSVNEKERTNMETHKRWALAMDCILRSGRHLPHGGAEQPFVPAPPFDIRRIEPWSLDRNSCFPLIYRI